MHRSFLLILLLCIPRLATARRRLRATTQNSLLKLTSLCAISGFTRVRRYPNCVFTWGTPRRNATGEVTNAVLLLHGTLGTGSG